MQFQCLLPTFDAPKRFKANPTLTQKLSMRMSLMENSASLASNTLQQAPVSSSSRSTSARASQSHQNRSNDPPQAPPVHSACTQSIGTEELNLFGGAFRVSGANASSSSSVNNKPTLPAESVRQQQPESKKRSINAFETMLANQQRLDREEAAATLTDTTDQQQQQPQPAPSSKRQKQDTAHPTPSAVIRPSAVLEHAQNRPTNAKTYSNQSTLRTAKFISASDFAGIQHICRNAGASSNGLNLFLQDVGRCSTIAVALCYDDCTTNHMPSSVRFCSPSASCNLWYCTCDKNIRAVCVGCEQVLGALVVMQQPQRATEEGVGSAINQSSLLCYFLPLAPCASPPSSSLPSSSSATYKLPLTCSTTLEQRITALGTILSNSNIQKVMYNLQLSSVALSQLYDVNRCHNTVDPRVGQYLLQPDREESALDLAHLLDLYQVPSSSSSADNNEHHMGLGSLSKLMHRTKCELLQLLHLWPRIETHLQQKQLIPLANTIEMPVAMLLGQMEQLGVAVDIQRWQQLRHQVQQQILSIAKDIHHLAGTKDFNIASPEQVSYILFDVLKIPAPKVSKSNGKFISTSEEVLNKIKDQHPIVEMVLMHRALSKLVGTFLDGLQPFLLQQHNNNSGSSSLATIHASWNQLQVRTGRLSCSKPNLQQVPANQVISGQTVSIRSLFVARPGYVLLAADYSQIEIRVLAHVSEDRELIRLFQSSAAADIYKLLASKIFNKPVDSVTDDERTRAKTICLGCIYGMGPHAAAAKLGLEVAVVSRITHSFFGHFSGVRNWISKKKSDAKQASEVRTISGRLRPLPDIHSTDSGKKAAAERQAVNTVIQGTASDLLKSAMLMVNQILDTLIVDANNNDDPRPRLIMQIHDELILEVPDTSPQYLSQVVQALRNVMEKQLVEFWRLRGVPLPTNISIGRDWGNMEPWVEP